MSDIPLTEFIYRTEDAAITSNKQWAKVCGASSVASSGFLDAAQSTLPFSALTGAIALFCMLGAFLTTVFVKRSRAKRAAALRLEGEDGRLVQVRQYDLVQKESFLTCSSERAQRPGYGED